MLECEFIIPGVQFQFHFELSDRLPDTHKGFLLEALCRYFNEYTIGGMQREDFGRFNLQSIANGLLWDGSPVFEIVDDTLVIAEGRPAQVADAYAQWADNGKAWTRDEIWTATGLELAGTKDDPKKAKGKKTVADAEAA